MSNTAVDDLAFKVKHMEGWMSVPQAARRWGVAELTVRKWIKQGKVITVSNGSHYLIDPKQGKPTNLLR